MLKKALVGNSGMPISLFQSERRHEIVIMNGSQPLPRSSRNHPQKNANLLLLGKLYAALGMMDFLISARETAIALL